MLTRCIFRGGLGNQMFQYALVMSLRKKGHDVIIDTSMYDFETMHNGYELERVFGIKEKVSPVPKKKEIKKTDVRMRYPMRKM